MVGLTSARASMPGLVAISIRAILTSAFTASTPSTLASARSMRRAHPPQRIPATCKGVHVELAGSGAHNGAVAPSAPHEPPHDPPHDPPQLSPPPEHPQVDLAVGATIAAEVGRAAEADVGAACAVIFADRSAGSAC